MTKIREYCLLSYLLILSSFSTYCYAQTQAISKKINQTNGLSNNRVRSIVKEKNGFVWIGTENGLNRFDGSKIKVYKKQNSALSSNDISDLFIDRKGRIWIGTLGGGLNIYNPSTNQFVKYKTSSNNKNAIPSNEINTIFEDSNGKIWLGTKNGLCSFDEAKQSFSIFKFDSNNDVRCIIETSNQSIWIGTFGGGLNKFDLKTKKINRINARNTLSPDYIHSLCQINNNEILVGTNGNGLLSFDINSSTFKQKNFGIEKNINIVRTIKKEKSGAIWIGTDGVGLFKIKNPNSPQPLITNFTNDTQLETSLSSNAVYALLEDENSNIWLGTAWNGVDVLSSKKDFSILSSANKGEAYISVLSVFKNEEAFFMGLDGKGLTVFPENKSTSKRYNSINNNSLGDDYIQFITQTQDQTLWMGTFVNGLVNFNYKTGEHTSYKQKVGNPNSLSFNDVRYVVEDEKNNLWVATWGGGVNYFDTKTKEFKRFKQKSGDPNSISSNNVLAIQKDKHKLWLATFGGGLNVLDTKTNRFQVFKNQEQNPNSISSDYIYCVLKDSKNNIWIGTAGEGINLLDRKTKKINRFDAYTNIRYQTVMAIVEDNKGIVWFSTKQGIFNYNYTTKSFKNFSNLNEEYHINSGFKDKNGILYFGCSKGVVTFNPENITVRDINPTVKFTGFQLFNKEVPVGEDEILKKDISFSENISLKHFQDVITIEFAAILFPTSANCEYQIKMENFDANWRSIGKESAATYTNLSPGKYIFKVRSRVLGSNWGSQHSSLNINIDSPFWLKWWAFIIYLLMGVFTFRMLIKYIVSWEKMKADLRLEKFSHEKDAELYNLKENFFNNISHEIRTPVTLILGAINKLQRNNTALETSKQLPLNAIQNNSEHLLNLVNELLDFKKFEQQKIALKVVAIDFVHFCKEIYGSFQETANQKDIHLEFETSTPSLVLWFDKNQMVKVLYNLFSNAVKFTKEGGFIQLTITENESSATLELTDSGVGISEHHIKNIFNRFYQVNNGDAIVRDGFGLGLTITSEIIKLHHGKIFAKSKEGQGSTFTIILNKGNSFFNENEMDTNPTTTAFIENSVVSESGIILSETGFNTAAQTLLLVEDNIEICNYIEELLSNEFAILKANDGAEGLELALEKLPDLIISDVMMPKMNGIELTKNLKSNLTTSHIPVILLTAQAAFANEIEGLETGADAYITKPFNEDMLRAKIKNILKNRSLLHQKFQLASTSNFSLLVKNKKDQDFLEKLGQFIEKNIESETLNAVFVAQELGMSHSVLYKKLKTISGLSLVEYIRDYKLKKAKMLLETRQFTVLEVCYQVGYSDRKYFSKLFKERFGNPPTFYLKDQ